MSTCFDEVGSVDLWPNCSVPDCPGKVCIRLRTGMCWPHSMGLPINWSRGLHTKDRERKSEQIERDWWAGRRQ